MDFSPWWSFHRRLWGRSWEVSGCDRWCEVWQPTNERASSNVSTRVNLYHPGNASYSTWAYWVWSLDGFEHCESFDGPDGGLFPRLLLRENPKSDLIQLAASSLMVSSALITHTIISRKKYVGSYTGEFPNWTNKFLGLSWTAVVLMYVALVWKAWNDIWRKENRARRLRSSM